MDGLLPESRCLTFYGGISEQTTNNFRISLCELVNGGAKEVTILFASYGGSTDDGIALHTYIKALPMKITMHAVGVVSSIAVQVFLAAPLERRFGSANSRFFFHETNWTFGHTGGVSHMTVREGEMLMSNAASWQREVTKKCTKLVDADFQRLKLFEQPVIIDPNAAVSAGIITAIREPRIPAGSEPRIVAI